MSINTYTKQIDIKSRNIINYLQYERFLKDYLMIIQYKNNLSLSYFVKKEKK